MQWWISSTRVGWDLARRRIWRLKVEGTCIANIEWFQGKTLSKKKRYYWRDISYASAHSWNEWRFITCEFSLPSSNHLTLFETVNLIPTEDLFKVNIDMPEFFWRD